MEKEKVFVEAIKEQEALVADLQKSLASYRSESDLDEGDVKDPEDLSRQSENTNMRQHFEQLLKREEKALAELKNLDRTLKKEVEPGALVITDHFRFLIGSSVNPFVLDGEKYQGMETDAPIYAFLRGKKKGDTVKFGQSTHHIEEVL